MENLLDAEELEAIRAAMALSRGPAQSRRPVEASPDARPIALLGDDRKAEIARPLLMKLASRFCALLPRTIQRACGVRIGDVIARGAEPVDGVVVREDLAGVWLDGLVVPARAGQALLAIGGSLVETIAARLLGDTSDPVIEDRLPSAAALRLFTRIGDSIAGALAQAWRDEQSTEVVLWRDGPRADSLRRGLGTSDVMVVLTVVIEGPAPGWIKICTPPDVIIPPPEAQRQVALTSEDCWRVLGEVPGYVRVELGRRTVTMAELGKLRAGDVIVFARGVGEPLPVAVNGIVKAWGKPVVAGGGIAIEISHSERPKQ